MYNLHFFFYFYIVQKMLFSQFTQKYEAAKTVFNIDINMKCFFSILE